MRHLKTEAEADALLLNLVPVARAEGAAAGGDGDSDNDAECQVCASADDAASMLLCDGCDEGYHMACLRPRLTALPAGSWHCPRCVKRRAGKGGPGAAGATGSAAGAETVYPCPCIGERLPGSGGRWPAGP